MERRQRVQRSTDENPDGANTISTCCSSSTCSRSTQGQNDKADAQNKCKEENTGKSIHRGESTDSSSPDQVEVDPDQGQGQNSTSKAEEEGTIDNLPPEMLTEILKFVDTVTLIKCRLVSRRWSEISTAIFRTRIPVIPIWFPWERSTETFCHKDRLSKSLKEFVECAKKSDCENGPFLSFWFTTRGSKCFDDEDFQEFLSIFSSQRLKYIKLEAFAERTAQCPGLVEKLGSFLLRDVPQLEELHLNLSTDWLSLEPKESKQVRLFPMNKNIDADAVGVPLPLPAHFQLPNLKLLHLDSWTILSHLQITKDLLNAAVNLTRIKTTVMSPEHFEFFHSVGKLHLLKDLVLCFQEHFVADMNREKFGVGNWSLSSLPRFQLENFQLTYNMERELLHIIPLNQASNLVSTLLDWSKESLKEMEICTLPFSSHLQLPVFRRLRTLKISGFEGHQIFPRGTRAKDIFPAVDSLELHVRKWPLAFPQPDSIPRLPSVKALTVQEWNFEGEQNDIVLSVLAQLCPNLKKLGIKKSKDDWEPPQLNFPEVARSIWTHMKQLESLEVDVDLDKLENNPLALDSCFSGISIANCQRLLSLTEAKRLLEENGIPVEIPEAKLTAEREHPSILDMKDLTNLTINPYLEDKVLNQTEFFTNKLTWISHKLAFKQMPHLKFNEGHF